MRNYAILFSPKREVKAMHRILIFDLDGTLAELGVGITEKNLLQLRRLERTGYKIAICSGKPTYYLCGFMRQVGLNEPILIGENGATFQFGVELPPKRYAVYPISAEAKRQLSVLKTEFEKTLGDRVWYQPNETALTPFPSDETCFDILQNILDSTRNQTSELAIYRHCDSFDIVPKNISKANGLAFLADMIGMKAKDFIAIGDGVNDLPMFGYADISIGIGDRVKNSADITFGTIDDALDYIVCHKP